MGNGRHDSGRASATRKERVAPMPLTGAAGARMVESSLVTKRRLWSTLLAGRRSQEVKEGATMSGERPKRRAAGFAP